MSIFQLFRKDIKTQFGQTIHVLRFKSLTMPKSMYPKSNYSVLSEHDVMVFSLLTFMVDLTN